jgi:hypothetical protein
VKRSLAAPILTIAFLFAAPSVHAQVPPPTLTGETLSGTTIATTSASCNPDGTSTFTYQTTGSASGPYNGTFSETGTVTIGPQPLVAGTFSAPGGIVTGWTASFTINSVAPAASITGTKKLLPPPPGFSADISGICESGTRGIPGFLPFPEQYSANGLVSHQLLGYTATISIAGDGQYQDSGTSRGFVSVLPATPSVDAFTETFVSQEAATIPLCDENSQRDQGQGANDQGCANP